MTTAVQVSPSAMTTFLQRVTLYDGCTPFTSIEMALALSLAATACRDALRKFVDAELISFDGFDDAGVESWVVSKTGMAVWENERINARVTQDKVRAFLKSLPYIIAALSKQKAVRRILIGGAWVTGRGYGPFLIGIEIVEGLLSIEQELLLLETALQLANSSDDELDPDTPIILLFTDSEKSTPQRLRVSKVVFEAGITPVGDFANLPLAISSDLDVDEVQWGNRLEAYADICGLEIGGVPGDLISWLLERPNVDSEASPAVGLGVRCPLLPLMIFREIRVSTAPSQCLHTSRVWRDSLSAQGAPDPKAHESCRAMLELFVDSRGRLELPNNWGPKVAEADYWISCGLPENLNAAGLLNEMPLYYWRCEIHDWMRSEDPFEVMHSLAVCTNEIRDLARQEAADARIKRPKRQTANRFFALFDVSQRRPQCFGLVRQPTGNYGNLKAALSYYEPHLLRTSEVARILYDERFRATSLCTVYREATDDEVELFQRISKQHKRTVSFLIEQQGETVVGFNRRDATSASLDLNLRRLPEGSIAPLALDSNADELQDVMAQLPTPLALRMRPWWVFTASTSQSAVAEACIHGPQRSLLARMVDPTGEWEFARISGLEGRYSASLAADTWWVRLEGIGSPVELPILSYGFGDHTAGGQLQVRSPYGKWTGMLCDLDVVLRSFRLLKEVGIEAVMSDYRVGLNEKLTTDSQRFEAIVDDILIGWLFVGFTNLDDQTPFASLFKPGERTDS